jgi:hypothetical protein
MTLCSDEAAPRRWCRTFHAYPNSKGTGVERGILAWACGRSFNRPTVEELQALVQGPSCL